MTSIELSNWLYKTLTKIDYTIRDIEQAVALSEEFGPDVERALCHVREKCEDAARLVRA